VTLKTKLERVWHVTQVMWQKEAALAALPPPLLHYQKTRAVRFEKLKLLLPSSTMNLEEGIGHWSSMI